MTRLFYNAMMLAKFRSWWQGTTEAAPLPLSVYLYTPADRFTHQCTDAVTMQFSSRLDAASKRQLESTLSRFASAMQQNQITCSPTKVDPLIHSTGDKCRSRAFHFFIVATCPKKCASDTRIQSPHFNSIRMLLNPFYLSGVFHVQPKSDKRNNCVWFIKTGNVYIILRTLISMKGVLQEAAERPGCKSPHHNASLMINGP